MLLQGKCAIVTGGLGKLGKIWINALLNEGAFVISIDQLVADSDHPWHKEEAIEMYQANILDQASLLSVAEKIKEHSHSPDILVNNVGIDQPPDTSSQRTRVEDLSADDFANIINVNIGGVFAATQLFGSAMAERRSGSIINIGSLYSSIAPEPEFYSHLSEDGKLFLKPPAYSASKTGVLGLTRYFARLWGPFGVRVNTLSPGGVYNQQDEEFVRKYSERVAMKRMARENDLVGPLLFLASDSSHYITGQNIQVDGGFTI